MDLHRSPPPRHKLDLDLHIALGAPCASSAGLWLAIHIGDTYLYIYILFHIMGEGFHNLTGLVHMAITCYYMLLPPSADYWRVMILLDCFRWSLNVPNFSVAGRLQVGAGHPMA